MSESKFSNQKSALEEYFESLLTEDDDTIVDDADELIVAKQHEVVELYVDVKVPAEEPVTDNAADLSASESEAKAETDLQPESTNPSTRRSSVEEMLANVETLADDSQGDASPDIKISIQEPASTSAESKPEAKDTREFAEPEPAIKIPLPEVAPPVVETETEPTPVETVIADTSTVETEQQVEVETEQLATEVQAGATVADSGIPEWAESPFQCLLFKVGGLSLAVPLVKLNGVIPWSENVTETPNQTDWYLGVLMNHGHKVQVIDTAVMVLPPEHRVEMSADPAERLSHILLVDDQRWGLACDCIGDVVWLKKDDVKWRSNKTKRPWLLGTAIEHMCAVMDTEAFADMLAGKP